MRYLCFDIGDKRTGIAAGDDATGLAGPIDCIESSGRDDLVQQLARFIDRENVHHIVVGLPYNMDDTEGPRAKVVRAIATQLREALGDRITIHFHDERLSSEAANTMMARTGLTHKQKKKRRDALAATAILLDYFESQADA